MRVLLFTSSHCAHCPAAERIVKKVVPEYREYGLLYRKIRLKSPEGKEYFPRYGVMGTPTIILIDDDGKEVKRIIGAPSENNFRAELEKLLGLRKKSFLGKFFGH
ncbi:MAG: thioredoxin fold domain-containing protein [Candidatus Aenigmarchaeota archaeon]|nr:thioredoxin fold domain-containing protein [Candidatus Aenigmarchaeota archaeon]